MRSTLLLLLVVVVLADVEPMLFNTGVNNQGQTRNAAGRKVETHWEIVSITKSDMTTVTPVPGLITWANANGFPIGPYLADNQVSQWIMPDNNPPYGVADATYRFRTRFDLSNFDVTNAVLYGKRACDDSCNRIRLNGDQPTSSTPSAGFTSFTDFYFGTGHLVAGTNSLTIDVVNGPTSPTMNPVALRVEAYIQFLGSSMDVLADMNVDFFNTGVDNTRTPLLITGTSGDPNVAPETHFTLASFPPADMRPTKIVQARRNNGHTMFPIPPWIADNTASDWIGVTGTAGTDIDMGVGGTYEFELDFDMTDLSTNKAKILGIRACDDVCGPITLNGGNIKFDNTLSDPANPPFTVWRPFVITTGFVSGMNHLKFTVVNSAVADPMNPVGLRVEMALRALSCHDCVSGNTNYVSTVCTLSGLPDAQAQCTACDGPMGTQYVTTPCSAGNYKTTLGMNTQFATCSEPTGAEYTTTICAHGTSSMAGTDTQFGTCMGPGANKYVTMVCSHGSSSSTGSQTVDTMCSGPSGMQYVTQTCMGGSYSSTGTNTQFGTCLNPTGKQYVKVACVIGSSSSKGCQTEFGYCKDPSGAQFTTAACVYGSYTMTGTQTQFGTCGSPSGSQYVTTKCAHGTYSSTGTTTQFGTCTGPMGKQYVSCPCIHGTYDMLGANTEFKTCSDPSGTEFVTSTCKPGSVNSAGSDTQTAECTVCSSFAIHACKHGAYNKKGKDTVCADPCLNNNGGCGSSTCVRTGNDAFVCVPFVGAPCERDVDCPTQDLFCFNAHCFVNACRVAPPPHCNSCMPTGNKKYRCCGPDSQHLGTNLFEEDDEATEEEAAAAPAAAAPAVNGQA